MPDTRLIGPWIRRFLTEHIVGERNLSKNTQASYRDTLVLLLPFAQEKARKQIDKLLVDDLSPEVVRLFLSHLESARSCSAATRNQRLAALHALARFVGEHSPEHIAWCAQIRSIPFKNTPRPAMPYLDKPEMDALLDAPDTSTAQGLRDYALLLFLYNTGTRADEAARATIGDLDLDHSLSVRITGKRGKIRFSPLWALTVSTLRPLIAGRKDTERVFLNCRRQGMTRFGVYGLVKRYVLRVAHKVPSLHKKPVSPHSVRHATAVHLLRAGADINTIRAWLGHVSLDTTNVYAEVDLEMKAKALAHCEIFTSGHASNWKELPELMAFLKSL
ncbi:MAG: tyrosine-type recombinase/integrase [Syntrophorhabdales bacterium]